MKRFKRST